MKKKTNFGEFKFNFANVMFKINSRGVILNERLLRILRISF